MLAPLPHKTLVINTIGEPGSGKTTLSFWLCQALKKSGVAVEFVPELVKYECFDAQGRARVRSGRFDFRYLTLQDRLVRPLMGQVEVVVNDGSYELFYFYAKRRMAPEKLARFKERIDRLKQRLPRDTEHWFVMPRRNHPYESLGRNESEAEARVVREEMLACLTEDFGIQIMHVNDEADRLLLLESIVKRVAQIQRL